MRSLGATKIKIGLFLALYFTVLNVTANDAGVILGASAAGVAALNMVKTANEVAQKEQQQQLQLEAQIKAEEDKRLAVEKRIQEMQQYDQWFFSLSKNQQFEELKKNELETQSKIKQQTAGIGIVSFLLDKITAPRNYFYNCD